MISNETKGFRLNRTKTEYLKYKFSNSKNRREYNYNGWTRNPFK